MLERFGLYQNPDGTFQRLDTQRSIDAVNAELNEIFQFNSNITGSIIFTGAEAVNPVFQRILENRGFESNDIGNFHSRLTVGREIGGAAAYTGDLELGLGETKDFVVFMSSQTRVSDFPIFLAEEIMHGQHIAEVINREGISFEEYRNRFGVLTEEFLGYSGRKKIIEACGLEGKYGTDVELKPGMTESDWGHLLGYFAVDDLFDRGIELPYRDLFRAPDEETFWQILRDNTGTTVNYKFQFPQSQDFTPLQDWLQRYINRCKADSFLQLKFSTVTAPQSPAE